MKGGAGLLQDGSVGFMLGEGIGALHWGRVGRRGVVVGLFYRTSRVKAIDITPKENPTRYVRPYALYVEPQEKFSVLEPIFQRPLTSRLQKFTLST